MSIQQNYLLDCVLQVYFIHSSVVIKFFKEINVTTQTLTNKINNTMKYVMAMKNVRITLNSVLEIINNKKNYLL